MLTEFAESMTAFVRAHEDICSPVDQLVQLADALVIQAGEAAQTIGDHAKPEELAMRQFYQSVAAISAQTVIQLSELTFKTAGNVKQLRRLSARQLGKGPKLQRVDAPRPVVARSLD